MKLSQLQEISHKQSADKGFWDLYDGLTLANFEGVEGREAQRQLHVAILSQKLALITSEVTEALEDLRADREFVGAEAVEVVGGKPEGFGSELADIIIRTLDMGGALGIDLEEIIIQKLEYNDKSRGRLHGRKF